MHSVNCRYNNFAPFSSYTVLNFFHDYSNMAIIAVIMSLYAVLWRMLWKCPSRENILDIKRIRTNQLFTLKIRLIQTKYAKWTNLNPHNISTQYQWHSNLLPIIGPKAQYPLFVACCYRNTIYSITTQRVGPVQASIHRHDSCRTSRSLILGNANKTAISLSRDL